MMLVERQAIVTSDLRSVIRLSAYHSYLLDNLFRFLIGKFHWVIKKYSLDQIESINILRIPWLPQNIFTRKNAPKMINFLLSSPSTTALLHVFYDKSIDKNHEKFIATWKMSRMYKYFSKSFSLMKSQQQQWGMREKVVHLKREINLSTVNVDAKDGMNKN